MYNVRSQLVTVSLTIVDLMAPRGVREVLFTCLVYTEDNYSAYSKVDNFYPCSLNASTLLLDIAQITSKP